MVASLEDTLEVNPDRLSLAKLFIATLDVIEIHQRGRSFAAMHRDGSDSMAPWDDDNALTIDAWIRCRWHDGRDVFD